MCCVGFYAEIKEFCHRGPESAPLLVYSRLSGIQRRKAHMMAAFLNMHHRSVRTVVNVESSS